jgi:hypothetical protein
MSLLCKLFNAKTKANGPLKIVMKTISFLIDTPSNSLKESNANPKVKTTKEGVGAHFLVGGRVGALGWGLK